MINSDDEKRGKKMEKEKKYREEKKERNAEASNAPVRRRIAFSKSRCSPVLPSFGTG